MGCCAGYNLFTELHGLEMVKVMAIVDSKMGVYRKIDGIPVILPYELISFDVFDYLIVCAINKPIIGEIIDAAQACGIKREIILPLRIFQIPFFDFDEYIKIKNSNISILSDYCFAGFLYHRFGFRFTSPTINMFSDNDNYLRFLKDIRGHFSKPMVEIKDYMDRPYAGTYVFPRGIVGDSEWCFNHDVSFETASDRWNRGVKRFNFDNYLVIMKLNSECAAYEFDSLPIKNKIGFFWKELGLRNIVYMPEWKNPEIRARFDYDFSDFVNNAAIDGMGIRSINWMKALLHKDDYKRVE